MPPFPKNFDILLPDHPLNFISEDKISVMNPPPSPSLKYFFSALQAIKTGRVLPKHPVNLSSQPTARVKEIWRQSLHKLRQKCDRRPLDMVTNMGS